LTTTSTRRRTRKSTAKKPATAATKTPTPTVLNTTVAEATKVTEVTPTQPTEAQHRSPDITKLRGFDFVVVPLIFLEAFVVNIVQNAGFKVPDRVAVQ
tara:strand:+ start:637 stop:930 length:294 start_codon:yes stop_codon:yes gene_type:complete